MNFRNFFLATALSLCGSLAADECCDPCDGWSGHIDYLYMTERNCHFDYALPFDGANVIGSVKRLCPDYDHGFRVGLKKECSCFTYGVDYTWFRSDKTATTTDPTNGDLAGTLLIDEYNLVENGSMQLARAKWDLDYDLVDLTLGYDLYSNCCFDLSMFGGLKFAFIDQSFEALYSQTTNITGATNDLDQVKQKVDMDAYGLQFGINTDYTAWGCVDFYGLFSFDLLAADFDRTFRYTTSTDGGTTIVTRANLKDECWDLVGVINLGVGMKYHIPKCYCSCFDSTLSIGYEFHQWIGTPGFLKHTNESGEITIDRSLDNLSFDGLVVSFNARF